LIVKRFLTQRNNTAKRENCFLIAPKRFLPNESMPEGLGKYRILAKNIFFPRNNILLAR